MNIEQSKNIYFDKPVTVNLKFCLKAILNFIKKIYYKILLNVFYPKKINDKEYNVSICAIFKNEACYLKEWILFNNIIGVDHFYLYNNNSSDNYLEVLSPFIKNNLVTLVDWPMAQGQLPAYIDCMAKYSMQTKWMGFIDIDEMIVPNNFNNIYDFLKQFEKNRPCVVLYWKMFCSSGLYRRDTNQSVVHDFFLSWDKPLNLGKCFFNTKYDFLPYFDKNSILHHFQWGGYKNIKLPPVNCNNKVLIGDYTIIKSHELPIQINHYFTKSYIEYVEKCKKGDVYFKINPHDEEYFYEHDVKSHYPDYSAYKYLIQLYKKLY